MLYNANRKSRAQPLEMEDFLLRTVEQSAQQQFDRMLATLSAVAVTRPPGYKRKRPRQTGERERPKRKPK